MVKREGTGMTPFEHLTCARLAFSPGLPYTGRKMGEEVICDMSTKGVKPDWTKFHEWERRYTREKLKKLTPTERIKIVEDLYTTALKIRECSKKLKKELES